MNIKLSPEELTYLLRENFLEEPLMDLLRTTQRTSKAGILNLTEVQADEFRDAFSDRMQDVGFDESYEPTREGKMLESLIDRFYVGSAGRG